MMKQVDESLKQFVVVKLTYAQTQWGEHMELSAPEGWEVVQFCDYEQESK